MRNTSFTITVLHLFSPISALSAESKSNLTISRFTVHGTLQINPSNFPTESGLEVAPRGALGGLVSLNTFVQGL